VDDSAGDYLVNPKHVASPYVILSFDTTPKGAADNANGVHPYDKTCRREVVTRTANPDCWCQISEFRRLSGIGGIVNPSLNLHGHPLVRAPLDAVEVFEKSGMQQLAQNHSFIQKLELVP